MGTPWPENQCAHRKRKIEELIQAEARGTAGEILSEKPTGDHDGLEKLLEKRFISFTESLSHVSLCRCKDCECEVTQIPNPVGSPINDQTSVDSGSNERSSVPSKTISSDSGSDSGRISSETISPDSGSDSGRISSETISPDSGSDSGRISSETISTPSSAAPRREEYYRAEPKKEEERKEELPKYQPMSGRQKAKKMEPPNEPPRPYQIVPRRSYQIVIGSFKRLTHLDMSKCYYLDHMPKEISNLLQLEVLEGFVVGNSMEKEKDSCTLEHLAKLTRLRELSICTQREDFPVISDLRDLNRLKRLHKLKIQWQWWGGVSVDKSENITKVDNSSSEEMPAVLSHLFATLSLLPVENDASPELPPQLEELHLHDLPRTSAPDWLRPSKRNKIKKLHIMGGPLSDLGQLALQEKSEWQVEILSLMLLMDLEMNSTDLRKLFPKLIYFEHVSCPKLQFSPCDGEWMKELGIIFAP